MYLVKTLGFGRWFSVYLGKGHILTNSLKQVCSRNDKEGSLIGNLRMLTVLMIHGWSQKVTEGQITQSPVVIIKILFDVGEMLGKEWSCHR